MTNSDAEPDLPGRAITVTVNGRRRTAWCADRTLLAQFVRQELDLPGTHVGCMNGDCGACTLRVDGQIFKSCLVFAASVNGAEITTVDGIGTPEALHPVQQAFWDADAFQCGFCTPGHLFAALDLLDENPDPTEEEIRHALSGNLCRCTGYQQIIEAVQAAARASQMASTHQLPFDTT